MKFLFIAIIFLFTLMLSAEAQRDFTKVQAGKMLELISYSILPDSTCSNCGIEGGKKIAADARIDIIYKNIAVWNACKPNQAKIHIIIDTIYINPVRGTDLFQLFVKGKSFPIKGIATISSENFNKLRKPIEYIIDLQDVFYLKSTHKHMNWHYLADDIGININKCTKPWKYDSPPQPKIEKPEVVEVPDK